MIYLDNAATTLKKPPEVGQVMLDALQTAGNPGRGAHAPTLHASRVVYETREALTQLFHAEGHLHRLCIQCDPGAEHGHQRALWPGGSCHHHGL